MKNAALLFALALGPAAAQAGTLWSQGPPNDNATNIVDYRLADDFVLPQASTVTGIEFWYQAQFEADLTQVWYAFYADAGGAPGGLIATGNAEPGLSIDGNAYLATFTIPALNLPAGAGWLELHAGASLTDNTAFGIWWAATDNNATAIARLDPVPDAPQTPLDFDGYRQYAFRLDGTAAPTPEPRTATFAAGAMLLAWIGRRVRK